MDNLEKILVVDDTPANLKVITEILSVKNYQVSVAISGERALKRLESHIPDLILLDIQMPGINGFETCQQIKKNPDLASIPIIFITALSDTDSTVKGFELGAVDYITKPFREAELLARVHTHLQLRQIQQTLESKVMSRTQDLELALARVQESQMQLVQHEKMSALGNLVAGVAHEINNPIGFISGNLDELQQDLSSIFEHLKLCHQEITTPEIQEHAKQITLSYLMEDIPEMLASMEAGCERICGISNSLRVFSRADKDIKIDFNIHEGIDSTLLILKHRLKANTQHPDIEILKEYEQLPDIKCFPGQLNQVFMNILTNAIDALEESNESKSYEEIEQDSNQILIKTTLINDHVHIYVRDNGIGMPQTIKQKIFDYLYTTKGVGKGTGLGLAVAKQIVMEVHDGHIKVESEEGKGTEFCIQLPIE
ncbi:MAG: response regulator [Cyanobacteria bacterium P01_D01_bin.156]